MCVHLCTCIYMYDDNNNIKGSYINGSKVFEVLSAVQETFSRKEYCSEFPCPPQGELPYPGIETAPSVVPALQEDSLPLSHQGKSRVLFNIF